MAMPTLKIGQNVDHFPPTDRCVYSVNIFQKINHPHTSTQISIPPIYYFNLYKKFLYYTVPRILTSTSKSNMWCVSCFHPGPQQNIIMCKVQIAMDDTTRVHIIQGRSHLTASRGKQDKARVAPVAPGFGRSGVSVGGFLQKLFLSNCWLFGQIFGRKLDPSQNFTDSKFPWRQKVRRGDNNSNGHDKIPRYLFGGAPARLLLEPTSVEAFDWNLRSLVSPRLNHHLPRESAIPWIGLGCDSMDHLKRWIANGYGMKIWPLMDIMYHKFYQFIHINSILMDSLTFHCQHVITISFLLGMSWSSKMLYCRRPSWPTRTPHVTTISRSGNLVGKTRGGIPTEDWSMETKNRKIGASATPFWRTGIPIGVSCQMMTPLLHQNKTNMPDQLTKDIEDRSLSGKRSIQTTHPHPSTVYI